jgi:SP family general alpha glucoside:H+ symporter-like MFS transporter
LIGNFFAYPTFAAKYGSYYQSLNDGAGGFQLTPAWQSGIGNASGVGAFFGVLANGWLVDRFGQKRTLLSSLVVLSAFVFITFFAPSVEVLTVGEFLCGLPWGVFASSAPAYASEVLPLSLRAYLTSYTNMCEYFHSILNDVDLLISSKASLSVN